MKEIEVKVIFLGQASVGKSSIIVTYTEENFNENLSNTIGVAFIPKVFTSGDTVLRLNIWDTCG
jgi:GTPase SAR1 family protein